MLYSFGRIKILTRNKTKSAVATAAYHSGSRITNEWDGVTHDYTRKRYIGETYIRMPENAPERYKDETVPAKERLGMIWNDLEGFEKASDAQLARQNYLALQNEFSLEQNLECVNRFIQENCTSQGMGVTYTVHQQPGNWHVDMMYLMREFDKGGKFKTKARKEYLCRNAAGEEKYLSADSFNKLKENGWEKVYRCANAAGEKKDLTFSEMEKEKGFERKSKYPIDRKVEVNTWNDKELAKKWRKSWEVILNDKFKELGMQQRVSCLSHAERGLNKLPTIHEGHGPDAAENREYNREVKKFNGDLQVVYRAGAKALNDTRSQIEDLEQHEQTIESIEAHEDNLRHNDGVIKAVVESGLFRERLARHFKENMDVLRGKALGLIEKARAYLKSPQKGKYEPERLSLDEIIRNGRDKNRSKENGKELDKEGYTK